MAEPLHETWLDHLHVTLQHGRAIGPRGFATRERLAVALKFDGRAALIDVPARKLNFRFAVAEWLWIWFGRSDLETLAQYNAQIRQFSDDGVWLTGAYGPHVKAQRTRALAKLRADAASRQSVVQIPRPQMFSTKDEPCTLSFQYLLRDDRLHCITTMRSSDAWLGVPYDAFSFGQIQNCMAAELGVLVGWHVLQLGSAHVYDCHVPQAEALLYSGHLHGQMDSRYYLADNATIVSPSLFEAPPAWLEDVLVTRDKARIATTDQDSPWWTYAQALCARTSEDARALLVNLGGRV